MDRKIIFEKVCSKTRKFILKCNWRYTFSIVGPSTRVKLDEHGKIFKTTSEEEEEEPLLIYTAQGSPFRCKKLSVINGSPERNNVLKLCIHMHYTNTNNNIDRKLCTNKRFRSK